MEDLGYETYQKILNQAVTELKNTEFNELFEKEIKEGRKISGADFVEDCMVETDMEMFFPDNYVPGSSERMLLYRELDNITNERDLDAYRKRLEDRFGPVPREGLELMQVVALRRVGRHLGCERIVLKRGMMQMCLVSKDDSPFFHSRIFGNMIDYVSQNHRRCQVKPTPGKRIISVDNVKTVGEAVYVLHQMEGNKLTAQA
jgi:transcription-repair coupling factor (superfamily II helicase)